MPGHRDCGQRDRQTVAAVIRQMPEVRDARLAHIGGGGDALIGRQSRALLDLRPHIRKDFAPFEARLITG